MLIFKKRSHERLDIWLEIQLKKITVTFKITKNHSFSFTDLFRV